MDVPGRPILYRTTETFLRTFCAQQPGRAARRCPALEENEQMELDLDGMQPVEPEQAASASDGGREETE